MLNEPDDRTSEMRFAGVRRYSIATGALSVLIGSSALVIWLSDKSKVDPCPPGSTEFFDLPRVGETTAVIALVLGVILTLLAVRRHGTHRVVATFTTLLVLVTVGLLIYAVDVHGDHFSSCLSGP